MLPRPEDRLRFAGAEVAAGRPVVRAVIVKTWGSTPREVGADMLLDSSGGLYGTVGGGCGEAEVYELAQQMLESPESAKGYLYHVDLTENPDEGGEKVCGGRFDVLLTRFDSPKEAAALQRAGSALESGQTVLLETSWRDVSPGFWRDQRQSLLPLEPKLSLGEGASEEARLSSEIDCEHRFEEPFGLGLRLVIVGAGHIARPLCRLANEVGYDVWILDDRADYARKEYFPEAQGVVAGSYIDELPALAQQPQTSVVLVTRGHRHDQDCLRLVARWPLLYLGMIGSKRRIDAVFHELVQEGVPMEALGKVHAPIGLEIGAHTPAEIAVSILAQMIMRRRLPEADPREALGRERHLRLETKKL